MRIMTEYGKSFSRLLWLVIGILVMLGQAIPAFAVKIIDVSSTRHNLSVNAPTSNFYADVEDEVCIFCHTPHNAGGSTPLWNRYSAAISFTLYSSATLEDAVYSDGLLPSESTSRLCLSCHEGTVALNALVNPGGTGVNPVMGGGGDRFSDIYPAFAGPYFTDDLTRMHPIGFDYNDASLTDVDIYDFDGTPGPENAGLKFIPGSSGEKFLECSTCHDPHVNGELATGGDPAYWKFLRIPNTSSAMCLACHNK